MADLIEYLRTRLDEREAMIRRLIGSRYTDEDDAAHVVGGWEVWGEFGGIVSRLVDFTDALADVAAKRRIIEAHSPAPEGYLQHRDSNSCRSCTSARIIGGRREHLPVRVPCGTLRLLALPYADRPDFDPAWRVDGVS